MRVGVIFEGGISAEPVSPPFFIDRKGAGDIYLTRLGKKQNFLASDGNRSCKYLNINRWLPVTKCVSIVFGRCQKVVKSGGRDTLCDGDKRDLTY